VDAASDSCVWVEGGTEASEDDAAYFVEGAWEVWEDCFGDDFPEEDFGA